MTDEEKRTQRAKLKVIETHIYQSLDAVRKQYAELCHSFTEDDLIKHGWVKDDYNGALQAYEYSKGNKSVNLRKTGEVTTYGGKPTRWLEDIQDLIDYETE
jgi:hypothetical protein